MIQLFSCIFLLFLSPIWAENDLQLTYTPGKSARVMILAHGMGGNYRIAEALQLNQTLVSFNFTDHDMFEREISFEQSTFGTFNELIPLLTVLKKCVITDGNQEIDLYGFSAGGGAIINTLAVLNTNRFDNQLNLTQQDKLQILRAIEKGVIILDSPLKSIQELIDMRGWDSDLDLVAKRYQSNDMEPIDAVKYLKGLDLHIIVHFQNPDEALFNRDDSLFFERLKEANAKGTTTMVIGSDGGHNAWHRSLWEFYNRAH